MNGLPTDTPTRALDFVGRTSTFLLIATMVLLAWVSSAVEFATEGIRYASMACLTMSVVFGIATLSLIPLIQEVRRPGQSNFDVQAPFLLFGQRSARLKSMLLPQYALLLAGLILFVIGMID
jgi:hypothetical protein